MKKPAKSQTCLAPVDDFTIGVRGKWYTKGTNVVVLDPGVAKTLQPLN
jgi:hypothetical protein